MESLSKAIQEPFVTDVIVPGISLIRDEMRIAEQEERIAAQAEAKRAAAAQALQQAAAAEQQGLDAEIAAAVSGVDVPLMDAAAMEQLSAAGRQPMGAAPGAPAITAVRDAMGLGPADPRSVTTARQLQQARDAFMRGDADAQRAVGLIAKRLKRMGMQDVAFDILSGGMSAEDALAAATGQLQQTQQRRGEQEAAAAATQRFERALAGELPQVAAQEAQAAMPIKGGKPRYPTGAPSDDPRRLARRAYEKHLKANPGDQEGAIAAAQQAFGASAPQPAAQAAQPQAIQRPELIEQANRLRQQATDMEREAKGIEATPVYRTFGDHAMAFLDALDSGDVATQMALMESVGGSTDYQPFGKGAVGKAIGKDASMRARRDLLDLKKKYLDAKRREDSAMKLAEKRAELRGRKKRTGGRVGGGYSRKDKVLMDALVALNRGDSLTENDKRLLRATKELTPAEIESLTPDRPAAWQALRTSMRGKRARADARSIMSGQATPEEQERAETRRLEREAADLRAEAKAATDAAEKARLEARADAKDAAAANAKKAAATRREQRADEKRALDRIAALQKSLDAVEITIAGESSTKELEKLQKQKEALETKIAELTGNLLAKAD
jgi:hypothetical protein